MLIASGVVSYMAPFTAVFRDRLTALWIERCTSLSIACSSPFSLTKTLGDAVKVLVYIDRLQDSS